MRPNLLELWKAQVTRNFLSHATRLLVLQLGRFCFDQGRERKHRQALRWVGRRLLVPILDHHGQEGAPSLQLERFDIQALTLHHGMRTTSGHYTTCLLRDVSGETQFWTTDDGSPAERVCVPSSVLTDSYLVLCSRVRAANPQGSRVVRPVLSATGH